MSRTVKILLAVTAVVVLGAICLTLSIGAANEPRAFEIPTAIPTTLPTEIPTELPTELLSTVAIVDGEYFDDLDEAIASAEGSFEKVVAIVTDGSYTVSTGSCTVIALSEKVSENGVSFADGMLVFKTKVSVGEKKYTAFVVYEKDYLISQIAESINELETEAVEVDYTGASIDVYVNASKLSDLSGVISKDFVFDTIGEFIPFVLVSDVVTVDGYTVFDGALDVNAVINAVEAKNIGLDTIANANSKTLLTITVGVQSGTTSFELPVNFTLKCSDSTFESIKEKAAKAEEYITFAYGNRNIILVVDARKVFDKVYASDIEEKGIKAVRDEINAMSAKEFVLSFKGRQLPSKYSEHQDTFDDVMALVEKVVNKVENSRYASDIENAIGTLDTDADGVYTYANTFSASTASLRNAVKKIINKKYASYADQINLTEMIPNQTITASVDVTVTVFDTYTATFNAEDGTELYSVTLLEGEIPEFLGEDPTKESTDEYVYTFSGWTNGTEEFGKDELCALTEDMIFTPVFDEQPVESVNPDLKFHHAAVVFESSLNVKFYAEKEMLDQYDAFYAIVNLNGEEYDLGGEENGDYYQFVFTEIAAKQMADEFTITLFAEKEVNGTVVKEQSEEKTYSIKEYAMNMLAREDSCDEFKTLLVDALVYGAEAQNYFGYNTDNLATADLTAEQLAYKTVTDPEIHTDYAYTDRDNEKTVFIGASLVFKNTINLKLIMDVSNYEGDVSELTMVLTYVDLLTGGTVDIEVAGSEMEENGSFFTYEFSQLGVREFRTIIDAVVYDAEGEAVSGNLTYSMLTYVYNKVNAGSEVAALADSAIKYADSAALYFNATQA